MNQTKTGELIYSLRKEKGLTQSALAEILGVSDKAISKWERGLGMPDVSLLPEIASTLGITESVLLSGEKPQNTPSNGNMRKIRAYVCPTCGNTLFSTDNATVSCCGKKLKPLVAKKATPENDVSTEIIENELFISSDHPMTKEHSITFVAVVSGDTMTVKKLYPEWNLQVRLPLSSLGMLIWNCSKDGLFYKYIKK